MVSEDFFTGRFDVIINVDLLSIFISLLFDFSKLSTIIKKYVKSLGFISNNFKFKYLHQLVKYYFEQFPIFYLVVKYRNYIHLN